ncbi:head GIN domain-containing protein [Sphingomonas japonica]|uniref:Putative auto-transporter adhesin head GIN domain-containing protein n=1 Tax=Sphingomonas japonica TaxID=511662 RepID=A0ABX0U3J3_9SPHN|nr:head GIN domain-containing protein [Sphingomonas japonica]NIJ23342.1 hypothetical protein [Sphingomonas japonica]
MQAIWLLAALPLAACGGNAASGEAGAAAAQGGVTRDYPVRDFTRVELRGSDDVEVRTGGAFAIRATGDPASIERLEIKKVGDELRIGRKGRDGFRWRDDDKGVTITVTMPAIRGGSLAGSGDLTIDRAEGDFDADLAGSGDLTVGALAGGAVRLSVAGSGALSAAGTADRLVLDIAGSGDIRAEQLRARTAEVSIAGSGDASAAVNGPAQVSLVGSGSADLGSAARCTVSKVGSGEARCGN